MRTAAALACLLIGLSAHATTITIEPDDYAPGTDLSHISPYVTLSRAGEPVLATPCCTSGSPPTGDETFGNAFGFFPSPSSPYSGRSGGAMFVIEFEQAISDISVLVSFNEYAHQLGFGATWIQYDDAGNWLLDTIDSKILRSGEGPWAIVVDPDPRARYLVIGGDDSTNALQVDRLSFRVPEPATLGLFAVGAIGSFLFRRKRPLIERIPI